MPSRYRIHNTGLSRPSLIIAALVLSIAALALMKNLLDPPRELKGEQIIRALKGGGYTLLFRHTARATNVTEFNDLIVLADCSTQIPLTELGRAQARSVGEAMRKLGIPIGETIASPFCRTMETARLIAGNARADNAVLGHADGSFKNTMNFTPLIDIMATPRSGALIASSSAIAVPSIMWRAVPLLSRASPASSGLWNAGLYWSRGSWWKSGRPTSHSMGTAQRAAAHSAQAPSEKTKSFRRAPQVYQATSANPSRCRQGTGRAASHRAQPGHQCRRQRRQGSR